MFYKHIHKINIIKILIQHIKENLIVYQNRNYKKKNITWIKLHLKNNQIAKDHNLQNQNKIFCL